MSENGNNPAKILQAMSSLPAPASRPHTVPASIDIERQNTGQPYASQNPISSSSKPRRPRIGIRGLSDVHTRSAEVDFPRPTLRRQITMYEQETPHSVSDTRARRSSTRTIPLVAQLSAIPDKPFDASSQTHQKARRKNRMSRSEHHLRDGPSSSHDNFATIAPANIQPDMSGIECKQSHSSMATLATQAVLARPTKETRGCSEQSSPKTARVGLGHEPKRPKGMRSASLQLLSIGLRSPGHASAKVGFLQMDPSVQSNGVSWRSSRADLLPIDTPDLTGTGDQLAVDVRRPSIFSRMFSAILTPRSDSRRKSGRSRKSIPSERSSESGGGDYFTHSPIGGPISLSVSRDTATRSCDNMNEGTRTSTPTGSKKHDCLSDLISADLNEHLLRGRHIDIKRRHGVPSLPASLTIDHGDPAHDIHNTGPFSDSAIEVRHKLKQTESSSDWFRQRIDEIMGEGAEDDYALAFDWDIPLHLPNSPLCPLNPKYRGKERGHCAYHSKGGSQHAPGSVKDHSET